MKALSVKPHWAAMIEAELKTIEIRSRRTNYRGPLLICASAKEVKGWRGLPRGVALCIVELQGCRLMRQEDEARSGVAVDPKMWSWLLGPVRLVERAPVKGQLSFFEVPDHLLNRRRAA